MAPIIAVIGGAAGTTAFLIAKFLLATSFFAACWVYLSCLVIVACGIAALRMAGSDLHTESASPTAS